MSPDRRHLLSRRTALAGFAMAATCGPVIGQAVADTDATSAEPVFSPSGPNAELYGAKEGFPIPSPLQARRQGNPFEQKYRVGAFSHFDQLFPTRRIERATMPWAFKRTAADIRYGYQGKRSTLENYLSRNPVTGLLVAKDDRILFEQYQYGRTDRDPLISQSMVKSIMGLLIGIAVSEGAIKSVDDTAETYVPGFRGTEYRKTPIRDLLRMSSGVDFGEERNGGSDLNRLWRDMVSGLGPTKGTIASIIRFNRRIAPPGTGYYYASVEPDVLGVVLRARVGRNR
jgi:CubicO group peptidase (beta-lactamase class C family)